MRSINLIFLVVFGFSLLNGQNPIACDGCIYDDEVVDKLKTLYAERSDIFYACELDKNYMSEDFAYGVYFETGWFDDHSLLNIFKSDFTVDELINNFPEVKLIKNTPIIRRMRMRYDDTMNFEYEVYSNLNSDYIRRDITVLEPTVLLNDARRDGNSLNKSGVIMTTSFEQIVIPQKYGDLINYVDCIIDTSSNIFSTETKYEDNWPSVNGAYDKLLVYLKNETKEFVANKDVDIYEVRLKFWNAQLDWVKEKGLTDIKFKELLNMALLSDTVSYQSEKIEDIVEMFYGADKALDMKRGRRVIGTCSMDNGPIYHLQNIAELSAKAANWDVFMRSHMNIINDRFDAAVRSSYGEASRYTPVKDFEVIGLEPTKLFCGSLLLASNLRDNHYWSSGGRIARAISQLSEKDQVLNLFEAMVKDEALDVSNRMRSWYVLLLSQNYITKDKKMAKPIFSLLDSISSDMKDRFWEQYNVN